MKVSKNAQVLRAILRRHGLIRCQVFSAASDGWLTHQAIGRRGKPKELRMAMPR